MSAGNLGKGVKDLAKVFGKEVTTKTRLETFEDAGQGVAGTTEGVVVADVGDDNVGVGECGNVGSLEDGLL